MVSHKQTMEDNETWTMISDKMSMKKDLSMPLTNQKNSGLNKLRK